MGKPLVNFIGIGAQKCASSWVYRILDDHPEACLSRPKELDYFSYFFGRGHDWYERHFVDVREARAIGDNSPSYLVHPLAPERARRYNPELRVIVALRDPIERAYSNHLHMVREGFLTGEDLSFERAIGRNEMYVEQSRYAKHLARWLDCFGHAQVHVLLQEEVGATPEQEARRLYEFLGLNPEFVATSVQDRANASVVDRSAGGFDRVRRLGRLARELGMGGAVDSLKSVPMLRRWRDQRQVSLRDVVPPMSEPTRLRLKEILSEDVARLRDLIGRSSLPWRNFGSIESQEQSAVPHDRADSGSGAAHGV